MRETALRAVFAAPVVSGDRHLLAVGTYEGARIVTPREFPERIEGPDP